MIKIQDGTLIIMEVMGSQVQAIGEAIRPLFADPVTYVPEVCGTPGTLVLLLATPSLTT